MKLCFVGSSDSVHTRRWLKFFVEAGDEVHLLTAASSTPRDVGVPGVRLHPFRAARRSSNLANYILTAGLGVPEVLRFRRVLRETRADLIHVHYVNDGALFAALAGVRPLVVTAWGSDVLIEPKRSWLRKAMVKYILRQADLVTCDAEHVRRALADLGAPLTSIEVVFFGTDTECFHPRRRDHRLREQLGTREDFFVISVRSLEPIYDVGSLIAAVPHVVQRAPNVKFIVGGTGSEEQHLKDMAEELGVAKSIQFVGWLGEEQLVRYLASADIYVSTALSDGGLAASTSEAMASGLGVIITDVGDNRSWVEDGVSGLVVPVRDSRAIARSIIRLAEDQTFRERLGRAGRQVIEERNNWRREMSRMRMMYQTLIGRTRDSP